MKNTPIACIILAAGKGTRMKSRLPKVMHAIAGRPMIAHVVDTAKSLKPEQLVVVLAEEMQSVEKTAKATHRKASIAIQKQQLGTGHAVRMAEPKLKGFKGIVFVLFGDTPLIQPETLQRMAAVMQKSKAAAVVLGMPVDDLSAAYGRLIVNKAGELDRIVEYKDATAKEKAVKLCNSGVMALDGEKLFGWLKALKNTNASGEYYLTDVIAMARKEKRKCLVVEAPEEELLGVNDRTQLAEAEAIIQRRLRQAAMRSGVTMQNPESVYLAWDTSFGQDVLIEPNVVFGPGVTIGSQCEIKAFSHLEDCTLQDNVSIGPYARLRPGTVLERDAKIGNFVEIKKATVAQGAKVNHLSYIGDATVGRHANIGAGTITCNYDGYEKHHTSIGEHAFIGSNTALVAPVSVGAGAIVGAGSVITEDVESEALSLTRPSQLHRSGWAKRFRNKKAN